MASQSTTKNGFSFGDFRHRLYKSDWPTGIHAALLISALGLAFYTSLIPRLDHAYPLHVDEWIHYDFSKHILENNVLRAGSNHEDGFHIFTAIVTRATGLTELQVYRWMPSVTFTLTAFMVYLFARRFGCGLESAFLVSIVPTTIRFLGPAFMVPVAMAMMVLPMLLFLAFSENYTWKHTLLSGLGIFFVTFTHPTSSILISSILLIISAVMFFSREVTERPKRMKKFILMISSVVGPALITLLLQWSDVIQVLSYLFIPSSPGPLRPVRDALDKFGLAATFVALCGLLALLLKEGYRGYALGFASLFFVVVITVHYKTYIGYQSMADRSWLHLLLLMTFFAAYGIASVRNYILSLSFRGSLSRIKFMVAPTLAVMLVAYIVIGGMERHRDELFYRLIDDSTAADFSWIKSKLSPEQRRTIIKTDLAFTFPALTGGHVYATEAFPFVTAEGREAIWYLYSQDGPPAGNDWIKARSITLVYAPHWTHGGNYLDQPRPGVFVQSSLAN